MKFFFGHFKIGASEAGVLKRESGRFDNRVPKKRVVLLSIFSVEMPRHEEVASKFNKGLVGRR